MPSFLVTRLGLDLPYVDQVGLHKCPLLDLSGTQVHRISFGLQEKLILVFQSLKYAVKKKYVKLIEKSTWIPS